MPSKADQLEKDLKNWIRIQFGGAKVADDLISALPAFYEAIRRAIGSTNYLSILREAKRILRDSMTTSLIDGSLMISQAAVNESSRSYSIDPVKVSRALVSRSMRAPLESNNTTINGMFTDLINGIYNRGESVVVQTFTDGLTIKQANQAILDNSIVDARYTEAFTRTAVNSTANVVKNDFYKKSDMVKQVIWVSTLDHRTSSYCSLMDRAVFPVDKGPRPPAHVNCRSTIVPVLEGESANEVIKEADRPRVLPGENYKKGDVETKTGKVRKPRRKDEKLTARPGSKSNYENYLRNAAKTKNGRQYVRDILGQNAGNKFLDGASLRTVLKGRDGVEEAMRDLRRQARNIN